MAQALLTPSYFKPPTVVVRGCNALIGWMHQNLVTPWEMAARCSAVLNKLSSTGDPAIVGMVLSPGGMPRAVATLVLKSVEDQVRRSRTLRLPG